MSWLGQSAVGIDLGDGTLKAALLSRSGRRVTLHRTWRVPCDTASDSQAVALDAAAELLRHAHIGAGTRVVLSAPSRGAISRTLLIPAMESERIAELVRYEVLSETTAAAEDLVIRHDAHAVTAEQQVHACALPRRDVDAFRAQIARRHIDFDDMEMPGLALASFVDHEMPRSGDRLLLGVGRLSSELVVLTADGLWMRHLPLGLAHAEPAALAQRLQQEIAAALAFFLPKDRAFKPHDVVLTEEGAMDAAFTGALRKTMGCTVTRVQSLQRISTAWRARHEGQEPEQALAMGKALGLALGGLRLARWRCPVLDGNPRRDALRQVPAAAVAVLLSSAALCTAGVLAKHRTAELDAALSIGLQGELRDRAGQRERMLAERTGVEQNAAALLAIAQRRGAVLEPRRAISALAALSEERAAGSLHLEHLWVASGEPGHPGVMTLTLQSSPQFDAQLGDWLQRSLKAEFSEVRVSGPEPAPAAGFSRWTVEIPLP